MNEQVKKVMQSALLKTSKSMGIDLKSLRIQMRLSDNNGVDCYAMNGKEVVNSISWNKILGIQYIGFKGLIVSNIQNKIMKVAKENELSNETINVRVYAINPNGEPTLHLFDGVKSITSMDINELV